MRTGLMLGAGALLAVGAIGITALVANSHGDAGTTRLPTPSPGPAPDPHGGAKTGISWSPDALLPDVEAGGAKQAEWAAEVLRHLDATGDGSLEHADGAASAAGGWGSQGPTGVVDALVARYDRSGDDVVDPDEAARMGADVAVDGWLSADAVARLRDDLRA